MKRKLHHFIMLMLAKVYYKKALKATSNQKAHYYYYESIKAYNYITRRGTTRVPNVQMCKTLWKTF